MGSLTAGLIALAMLVAACSGGGIAPGSGSPDQAWRTASLRDVLTGEELRVSELEGKLVAIETMAIWCSTCRIQQGEAKAALEQVVSPDLVYISVDVDPNERAEDLAAYARSEGFTWRFVVASPEVSRSLAAAFGDQILSPPATPLILIGPDGALIEKHIGIRRAAELTALFLEHLP